MIDVVQSPIHRQELENLRRIASGICTCRLGPTDHIAPSVRAGSVAVITTECRKGSHHVVLPSESTAGMAGGRRHREEVEAAPVLLQRVDISRFGDADDHAVSVVIRPLDSAIGPPKRAEVGDWGVTHPQGGVLRAVTVQVRRAGDPTCVVDAVAGAGSPPERPKNFYGVVRWL